MASRFPFEIGPQYEGQSVRKEEMHLELAGPKSFGFELALICPLEQVEDGKVELIGPDLDQFREGSTIAFANIYKFAGEKLTKDLESVFERRIHHFQSFIDGFMHLNSRDLIWLRIHKDMIAKGLSSLKQIAEATMFMFKSEYKVIQKAQALVITDPERIKSELEKARPIWQERDARMLALRDEDVDEFYSCVLCLPADQNIILADGSIKPIRELVMEFMEQDRRFQVLSFDGSRIQPRSVVKVFMNPAPAQLLRIGFSNGNSILLTGNHKVLVDAPWGLDWVRAEELRPGDRVISCSNTYLNGSRPEIGYPLIIDFLPDDFKVFDPEISAQLKQLILGKFGKISNAASALGIEYGRLWRILNANQGIQLGLLKQLCTKFCLDWESIKPRIKLVGAKFKLQLNRNYIDEDLAYLLGLVASDGRITKRYKRAKYLSVHPGNTRPELLELFREIASSEFGLKSKIHESSTKPSCSAGLKIKTRSKYYRISISNTFLPRLFMNLGITKYPNKWNASIISSFHPSLLANFIAGLFDGDGHIMDSHATISTGSYTQAQLILLLLKKLGINCYIARTTRGYQVCTRSGADLLKFRELIHPKHPAKHAELMNARIRCHSDHPSKTDLVPLSCGVLLGKLIQQLGIKSSQLPVNPKTLRSWITGSWRASKQKLRSVLEHIGNRYPEASNNLIFNQLLEWTNSNLLFERVKSLEWVPNSDKIVYNLEVADTHNYMAQGIILRNCQSFAPTHVCIITPQRPGLCGSMSYLDAKAAYQIDPLGPNQPISKGECLNQETGEYSGVNQFALEKSGGNTKRVELYKFFTDAPHTSCGCFQVLGFYIPEVDGIGWVERPYAGTTPNGLRFSTMAGMASGGRQTYGFLGVSYPYMKSPMFLKPDGGYLRTVWMNSELKQKLSDVIPAELKDKIATENEAQNIEQLKEFLIKQDHPVVKLWKKPEAKPPVAVPAEEAPEAVPAEVPLAVAGAPTIRIILRNAKIRIEKLIIKRG